MRKKTKVRKDLKAKDKKLTKLTNSADFEIDLPDFDVVLPDFEVELQEFEVEQVDFAPLSPLEEIGEVDNFEVNF